MPRNDEGEFELVLGNRQLLSVFFVIVILMGVCFAAGYIFGRNSAPAGVETARQAKGTETAIVVEPASSGGKGESQRSGLAPGQAELRGGKAPAPAAKEPEKPAAAGKKAEQAAAPPPEPVKPAPVAAKPPAETPRAAPAAAGVIEPTTGQTFLQVAAVKRPDADTLVGELRKKEFKAFVAVGPSESLFRVVVGPVADVADLNKVRSRLKELGFDPIVKRY